jgi:hypothetical protein
LSGVRLFHGQSIYRSIYFATKKLNILAAFLNGDLRPLATSRIKSDCGALTKRVT